MEMCLSFSHMCVYNWTVLTSPVPHSISLCTFPGRAVQWISPWMYVTMMMTDQIPLDLAPPPLLNGEVPLMPHMVNGDAAQQVIQLSFLSDHVNASFNIRVLPHMHTNQMHARIPIKQSYRHFSLLSFHHMAHGLLPQVMNSCWAVTIKHLSYNRNRNKHRCIQARTLRDSFLHSIKLADWLHWWIPGLSLNYLGKGFSCWQTDLIRSCRANSITFKVQSPTRALQRRKEAISIIKSITVNWPGF